MQIEKWAIYLSIGKGWEGEINTSLVTYSYRIDSFFSIEEM